MEKVNSRMNIYDVLDRINEEVGYVGVKHEAGRKDLKYRDDVISSPAFHNWKKEFNEGIDNGVYLGSKLNEKREGKYITYLKADIDRLINIFRENIEEEFEKKTIPLKEYKPFGLTIQSDDPNERIAKTKINGTKKFDLEYPNFEKEVEENLKETIERLIDIERLRKDIIDILLSDTPREDIKIEEYIIN